MSFKSLGLNAEIVRAVPYEKPSPIQAKAIPVVLEGRDLMAGAQTGTGKTAGFTLPILHRLSENTVKGRPVRALVLVPTRELAAQVFENVRTYSKNLSIRSAVIFGGVNIRPQINQLRSGVDLLIATPGRLLDHVNQGNLKLDQIETLVLDEADRMLDMGFIPDIKRVVKLVPAKRQTLLFSATFSPEIKKLAANFLNNPAQVQVSQENATADRIAQVVQLVDQKRKRELLSYMVGANNWEQVLVFTRTKHGANRLAGQLEKDGITAAAIHGNKSQGARTRALKEFKQGKIRALVATDIAARGIDIDQLPHVINYELPQKPEDYVHRIGRTGRAGREGEAISFVCREETKQLRDIEKLLKFAIPQATTEGFEPDGAPLSKLKPEKPARKPGGGGNRGRTHQRNEADGGGNRRKRPSRNRNRKPGGEQGNTRRRQANNKAKSA
jgi:ATP-dependent RNA helicase RhlE